MLRSLTTVLALAAALAAPAALAANAGAYPNLFFSPLGKPFRGGPADPYAVAQWFKGADANADGKLDKGEFVADAAAWFKQLDLNSDGVLGPYEIQVYEKRLAPEILGVRLSQAGAPRLILAQGEAGSFGGVFHRGTSPYGAADQVVPSGTQPGGGRRRRDPNDPFGQGAEPFALLAGPEPVTSTDPDFLFRGQVRGERFMAAAEARFAALDTAGRGYLTLDALPKTPVQQMIESARR